MRVRLAILSACVVLASSCIVEAPGSPTSNQGSSRGSVVTNIPPTTVKSGANLDDKVEITSVTMNPGKALPGERVEVTVNFKVLAPIEQDYLIFVHVEDAAGKVERMNVDHAPVGGRHPTSQWKPGETVQDTFEVSVPPGSTIRAMNIWLGLWHAATDTRLPLKNPTAVRNDGRDRILIATLPVAG